MRISELICLGPKQKYFCKRGRTSHFGKHEVICPSGQNHPPWSSTSPAAKVRYAAHSGLHADMGVGPKSATKKHARAAVRRRRPRGPTHSDRPASRNEFI